MIVGTGLTVMVAVVVLKQPVAVDAKIVKVVTCCVPVELVSVPEIGDPVPLAAIPVRSVVLPLVQVRLVPATLLGLEITMSAMAASEQIV